ncbi:uncharacterized protein DEA37_0003149 [Paragonimus westermani]|uniref:Uncharacterized protein n=1 Tax=Paragonimus westermani TaxID=34504 RepID=A0A5J4NPN9_9TREM|nr:uncharacterized protein DEA37_0003149 [Paragonimus westermani]
MIEKFVSPLESRCSHGVGIQSSCYSNPHNAMESVLAKLAVYNTSDLFNHLKGIIYFFLTFPVQLPLSFLLTMVVCIGCVAATVFLYRAPCKNNDDFTKATACVMYEGEIEQYIREWLKQYKVSSLDICLLWLRSVNEVLYSLEDKSLLIHSIESEPMVSFKLFHQDSHSLCSVNKSIMACISHEGSRLTEVQLRVLPVPDFFISVDDHLIDAQTVKVSLSKALSDAKVEWKPGSPIPHGCFFDIASANDYNPANSGDVIQRKASSEESTKSPLITRNPMDPDALKVSHFPLDGLVTSERNNFVTASNAKSYESLNRCSHAPNLLASNDITHSEVVVNPVGGSYITHAISNGTLSSYEDSAPAQSVILAHNAQIRQSITARQVPKKATHRLVRSASYYGENSSVRHHSQEIADSREDIVGDLAPISGLNTVHPDVIRTEVQPTETIHFAASAVQTERDQIDHNLSQTELLELGRNRHEDPVLPLEESKTSPVYGKPRAGLSTVPDKDSYSLTCKKLLIKVVKAEGLILKGSVSKGRAELLLPSLFSASVDTDEDIQSLGTGACDASEFRRRLPLIDRTDSPLFATNSPSPTVTSAIPIGSSVCNIQAFGACHTPIITAEFHFMERANEDALAAGLRSHGLAHCPSAMQRACSSRIGPQSFSAQDSPILGYLAMCNSLSHSTSLEFPNTKFIVPKHAEVVAEAKALVESNLVAESTVVTAASGPDQKCAIANSNSDCIAGIDSMTGVLSSVRTAKLLSPALVRRAQIDRLVLNESPPDSPASIQSTSKSDKPTYSSFSTLPTESNITSPIFPTPPNSPSRSEVVFTQFDLMPETAVESIQDTQSKSVNADNLRRSESLLKRSNLIASAETGALAQQSLLPYPDSDFDATIDDSNPAAVSHAGASGRSQSLATRFKPSRLLGTGMLRSGKRSSEDSAVSSTNSLALLGPSRQLAGMVASLSTLPTDLGTSPISAAALASAIAVAGATGSWQHPQTAKRSEQSDGEQPIWRQSKTGELKVGVEPQNPAVSASHDPPVRSVPPAASIAAGAEKLLYLENSDLEDFDAISTEGYYRIVQDNGSNERRTQP